MIANQSPRVFACITDQAMAIFDIPWLSESIKKRALRYLLQRYLGNFLLEKLTLDQLSLDLYEGIGAIRKIQLDVDTINDEFNHLSSFKFIDGQINELSVCIPWSSLLTDSSKIRFEGISLNLCKLAHKRTDDLRESNHISKSLMTSSMQIAEEIVNDEQEKFDGLEMFAQLIDSVLRRFKLSADDTSFKFVFPRKTGDGQEIEIKVKHVECEEEEHMGDDEQNDQNLNIVSQSITKIISLEGIEVFINSVSVSKLNGKHSLRLQIDENRTDLEIIFGSHIFAIINSKHLETLIELFECGEQMPSELSPMAGDKLMSSQDYLRVEQLLQTESGCSKPSPSTVISSTSVTMDSNKWTSCGFMEPEEEPKFLPLKKGMEGMNTKPTKEKSPKKSEFKCHLQIPGLTVCLLCGDFMPRFEGMPIIETQNSFPRINSFLDKLLNGFNHLRFLSLQFSFDIDSESFSFSCGDLMVSEVLDNYMNPMLWNRIDNQVIVNPFLRFKSKANAIQMTIDSINVKLDPTFLERFHQYFSYVSQTTSSQSNSEFDLQIVCDNIRAELLFPIPDLRPLNQRSYSQIRNESLRLILTKNSIKINQNGGQIECKSIGIDFKADEEFINICNGYSSDKSNISFRFRIGSCPPLTKTLTEEEVNQFLDAEMEDSIYVGQTAPQLVTEPFQVKRKVIGRDANENEQVLTPGDRNHLDQYLETANTSTELYFEMDVPTVEIRLRSKEQFELLYNRIANDLILYIPYKNISTEVKAEDSPPIAQNPTFFSCKAVTMSDSISTNSSFHSFTAQTQSIRTNLMVFVLTVDDMTFQMGSKQEKTQELFGQNVMLGVVIGDHNESSSSLCMCCENLSLKSDSAVVISGNIYSEPNCTFNLALDINRESDVLKKIKLAIQLSCAAMYEIQIDVFEQLWDFINVTDEKVIGYIPPKVITELHIDLLDSAIALENLTTRPALITFEDIYLTSMVVENTNQTLLRIFAEETLVCLKRNKNSLEAMKNYICVIQSGIIDLNLKFSKDEKLEFKMSNNAIDVRVCADSFTALCQIISSLTANSSNVSEIESIESENTSMASFDGDLMEDAMGDSEQPMSDSDDNDEEPPKFCQCPEIPQMDESGFWILGADDWGTGIKQTSEPQIRVLSEDHINIVENHFNISRQKLIPDIIPQTLCRYFLEEMTLILHLFKGNDFDDELPSDSPVDRPRLDDTKSYKSSKSNKSYHSLEHRVRFADGSVNMTWEDIELGHNSMRPTHCYQPIGATNSFKYTGGTKRQTDTCVLLCLHKVKTLFENFEPEFALSWRFLFMVQDVEIIDRVAASKIKKMLYEYCSETMPRRKHTNMITVKATTFRNADSKEESELKISMKPLRINIDQDTLLFLGEFFSNVIATLSADSDNQPNAMTNSPTADVPTYEEAMRFDDNSSVTSEVSQTTTTTATTTTTTTSTRKGSDSMNKVFFRLLSFSPDVPIRLDYHGKHVDFERVN